jgi:hypothetical protein
MTMIKRRRAVLLSLLVGVVVFWVATGLAQAAPPVNSTPPSISGIAAQGQTLTVTQGTWNGNPTPIRITDRWFRCDATGASCNENAIATGASYTLKPADVGHTIVVVETATAKHSKSTARSKPTAVVIGPPENTGAPTISGTLQEGSVLTAGQGTWTNSPTSFSYLWLRCKAGGTGCVSTGVTTPTYTLTAGDVGSTIEVAVTASNAARPSNTAFSAPTGIITAPKVTGPAPTLKAPPTIFGVAQQGQTLQAAHGTWTNSPTSFVDRWARCGGSGCIDIPGANGQSYTLTAADVGQTIIVRETAINGAGASGAATSAASPVVRGTSTLALLVSPTGPITNQLVTLVATVSSSSSNAPPSGTITFLNGGTPISGCVNETISSNSQSAAAICQAALPAGTASFAAVYKPHTSSILGGSASSPRSLVVGKDSTSTSLRSAKRVAINTRARYTATVLSHVSNSGPFLPSGSVEFFDRGRPISACKNQPLNHSAATCTVKYKSIRQHRISAQYLGDANFGASQSLERIVRAVNKGSVPKVAGFIGAYVQWKFAYHPTFTQVLDLRASGVGKGMTLRLACTGSTCPFKSRTTAVKSSCSAGGRTACSTSSAIDLLPYFHNAHLPPGSRVTMRITRPRWVGKYYSFTVQAGHPPEIGLSCLAPGSRNPGVGC